ncbi:hydroxylysine kinase-like [Denticeps clupeoides]|uniref:Hydroxylysine kinase n=1 Tax=Denticeps clupeoides TaxID=299321 RepID=A0AAY4EBS6_9TELE|nr:hydroxylysine kinase [Denticeps clupeoides]
MALKESKPNLSESQVSEVVKHLYGLTVSKIQPLPSYDDQNFCVRVDEHGEYVLKIVNSTDSLNTTVLEIQTHAMNFLHQRGVPAQTAIPTCSGQLMTLLDIDCGFGTQKYMVRLLTYLSGTVMAKIPSSPHILYEVGKMAATMDRAFQEMEHPHLGVLQREGFIWSLSNVPLLEHYLPLLDGDPIQAIVQEIIDQFKLQVVPNMRFFRKCINHGDFNDHNILAEPDGTSGYRISGILDFGDMSCGYYIFELAITIMYMMIESASPLDVGGHVLAGWESIIPLNAAERKALFLLVLCRFCQSVVIARYTVSQQPENEEYLMITSRTGKRILSHIWEVGREELERRWTRVEHQYSINISSQVNTVV